MNFQVPCINQVSPEHGDTPACDHRSHVPSEFDLNVGQSTLRMHTPQCPNTVNDERVPDNRGLEALHPAPYLDRFSQRLNDVCRDRLQVILRENTFNTIINIDSVTPTSE